MTSEGLDSSPAPGHRAPLGSRGKAAGLRTPDQPSVHSGGAWPRLPLAEWSWETPGLERRPKLPAQSKSPFLMSVPETSYPKPGLAKGVRFARELAKGVPEATERGIFRKTQPLVLPREPR